MLKTETQKATFMYGRIRSTFIPPTGGAPALMMFEYQTPDYSGSFFEGTLSQKWCTRMSWSIEVVPKDGRWMVHPADRWSHARTLRMMAEQSASDASRMLTDALIEGELR